MQYECVLASYLARLRATKEQKLATVSWSEVASADTRKI